MYATSCCLQMLKFQRKFDIDNFEINDVVLTIFDVIANAQLNSKKSQIY